VASTYVTPLDVFTGMPSTYQVNVAAGSSYTAA
jgi:hypothetical protein